MQEILEIEAREVFIREMLAKGHSQRGLYPMGPEMEKEFECWRAERAKGQVSND